jgi:hypothetical protein
MLKQAVCWVLVPSSFQPQESELVNKCTTVVAWKLHIVVVRRMFKMVKLRGPDKVI